MCPSNFAHSNVECTFYQETQEYRILAKKNKKFGTSSNKLKNPEFLARILSFREAKRWEVTKIVPKVYLSYIGRN